MWQSHNTLQNRSKKKSLGKLENTLRLMKTRTRCAKFSWDAAKSLEVFTALSATLKRKTSNKLSNLIP